MPNFDSMDKAAVDALTRVAAAMERRNELIERNNFLMQEAFATVERILHNPYPAVSGIDLHGPSAVMPVFTPAPVVDESAPRPGEDGDLIP